MENGAQKKSPIKIILIVLAAILVVAVVAVVAFSMGKGSEKKTSKNDDSISEDEESDDEDYDDDGEDGESDKPSKKGKVPVLGTELEDYMLWGWYLPILDGKSFDYQDDDCKPFCDIAGMTSITVSSLGGETKEFDCAKLPARVRIGRPTDIDISLPSMHDTDPNKGLMTVSYPEEEELEELKQDYVKTFGEDGIKYYQNFLKYLNTTFAEIGVCNEKGYVNWIVRALVKVDGNTVSLVNFTRNNQTAEIIEGDTIMSFNAYFDGIKMVLQSDEGEIEYLPYDHTERSDYIQVNGYARNNDETYNDIVKIFYSYTKGENADDAMGSIEFGNGDRVSDPKMAFNDNGTFEISWDKITRITAEKPYGEDFNEHGSVSGEYIWNYGSGLVISVDGGVYRYHFTNNEYKASVMDVEGDVRDDEMPALITTQQTINDQIITELAASGIDAETDSKGRIVISTNILFDVDSDEISEEGLAQLEKFFEVYARVVLPYIENGSVAYVEVGGHTDTDGTYDYNLDLSQRRAESVSSFALTVQPELGQNMKAQGYSFSDPVINDAGDVDKDASRRVVFKIVLNR